MLRKNIMQKTTLPLVTAAFLMLAAPALAATPEPGGAIIDETTGSTPGMPATGLTTMTFDAVDKDANGRITRDEFQAQGMTDSLFTTMDTDHDGTLSPAEVSAHGPLIKQLQ